MKDNIKNTSHVEQFDVTKAKLVGKCGDTKIDAGKLKIQKKTSTKKTTKTTKTSNGKKTKLTETEKKSLPKKLLGNRPVLEFLILMLSLFDTDNLFTG